MVSSNTTQISENRELVTMQVSIKDGKLIITVDLESQPTLSSSGKNLVVASSRGPVQTDCKINGKNVTVGFNAYIKA